MPKTLSIKDLKFAWPSARKPTINIDLLEIDQGEKVFIKGPSGSGKSTLLNLIGGVIEPQNGDVLFSGETLFSRGASERDKFRADHMGFIFQMFNLLPYLSAKDNVLLPCRFSKLKSEKIALSGKSLDQEAERLLLELGLSRDSFNGKNVTDLSVGQQQRVATARALMGRPELIIADEPTSALDTEARDNFMSLLFRECGLFKSTLVFVSHDSQLGSRFDRVINLEEINAS